MTAPPELREKQTAAHAEVSEKDELTARLLTHPADAKKGVLLLLGEGDEQAPYLALSAKHTKPWITAALPFGKCNRTVS